jgi:hypothetical protein
MSGDKVFSGRVRFNIAALVAALGLLVGTLTAPRVFAQGGQPVTFEKTIADLRSQDAGTRLRAVQMLKAAGYPEAAAPMAPVILDPFDETQLEAIAAELNIFLADKVTPRKRVGLLVEVRNRIAAEPIFAAGPSAVGANRVRRLSPPISPPPHGMPTRASRSRHSMRLARSPAKCPRPIVPPSSRSRVRFSWQRLAPPTPCFVSRRSASWGVCSPGGLAIHRLRKTSAMP